MPIKHLADGTLALRLSYPNPADANIVRVFDWQNNGQKFGDKPVELLGPGSPAKTSAVLDKTLYLTGLPTAPKDSYRDLVMEGLTYGTATLKLELIEVADPSHVISSDEVKVTVNVDQYARTGADLASEREAISLRGKAPHYLGIRGMPVGGTAGFLRAVRGRITCKMPSYQFSASSQKSHLSPMHDPRKLRFRSGEKDLGQSLWMGIKQNLPNGGMTWVQCGLRWFQAPGMPYTSPPLGYLETGTFLEPSGIAHTPKSASPAGSGYGADSFNIAALQGWESAPLVLDFVMWKDLKFPDEPDAANAGEWHVLFKDARTGKDPAQASSYLHLHAGASAPQLSAAQRLPYDNAYNMQKMNILDANLESTTSISFAPGTSGQKGSVSNFGGAAFMVAGVNPNYAPSGWPQLWTWLGTAYAWEDLTPQAGNVKAEIRTGRNAGGDAEIGTAPHPYWHVAPIPHGFELWDDRPFGFATQP